MTRAEVKLRRPPRGGAIQAAKEFGIDLTLLVERLRRSPEERLLDLQEVMMFHEELRGAARSTNDPTPRNVSRTREK